MRLLKLLLLPLLLIVSLVGVDGTPSPAKALALQPLPVQP